MRKEIASIEIISPGSPPDVDTDFHTEIIEDVVEHLRELFGSDSVANISTQTKLKGKSAFKQICTIYEIPFPSAQKISDMIPNGIEGNDPTIEDLFNPESDFYEGGAEFRTAVSDDKWKKVLEAAKAIEHRTKTLGTHACGIIVSAKPLLETTPMMRDKKTGKYKTQWAYPQLEEMGLIKLDLLGLDTVNLIHQTLENIIKKGKEPPNILDLFAGDRNDKKTYELLAKGETEGIFQLASPGMKDLLRRMNPRDFEDIVAVSALYRPGPMGTNSHTEYAERRSGRKSIESLHPEFKGSPLDDILSKTQGILVYQEQVMQIANIIAGMTLQEGDDLRKAMGKKKKAVMDKMRPKFIRGGINNGYSAEAMEHLWDTMVPFSKYAFNRSHSVAYGLDTYATAYLKANYPVEFMAALISQKIKDKDKVRTFLQDASRMKITMGALDINASDVKVSPNYNGVGSTDILYGLGGIKAVTEANAEIIVKEREENGLYSSVQDVIKRCARRGLTNKKIFESLALAGAFDTFNVPRAQIVENLEYIIKDAKKTRSMGTSLFDMFGITDDVAISLDGPEYSFPEKMKYEAEIVGMYVSDHPLAHLGPHVADYRTTTIEQLANSNQRAVGTLVATMISLDSKTNRRGQKTIKVELDDGTGYLEASLSRNIVKGLEKKAYQEKIKKSFQNGETNVTPEAEKLIKDETILPLEAVELNTAYILNVAFRPSFDGGPPLVSIINMKPLTVSSTGELPLRIRVFGNTAKVNSIYGKLPKALQTKFPGETPILIAKADNLKLATDDDGKFVKAVDLMKDSKGEKKTKRSWPPKDWSESAANLSESDQWFEKALSLDINYVDTGYTFSPSQEANAFIEKFVGVENYDYGSASSEAVEGV